MVLVFSTTELEILLGLILVLWGVYKFFTKNYDFWARRGVPFRPASFPFGSMKDFTLGRSNLGDAYAEIYREFPDERFCGVVELRQPILVIRDPELIKHILAKDFSNFVDRVPFDINPRETISGHLFLLNGETWRNMRQKLSPAFSSGKMKNMFRLMVKCSEQLRECLLKMAKKESYMDVKDVSAKFTMDVIATCAFGVEINSLSGKNSEFYQMGISIFKPPIKIIINYKIISLFPMLGKILNLNRFGVTPKKMIHSMVVDTVKHREENNICRNDFLDILINLKQNKSINDECDDKQEHVDLHESNEKEGLTLEQMTAQVFIFFIAGYETSSSTMTFCLYELAQHQDIQERVWKEVVEVLERHGGEFTYQALQEMKYMDQVINETLRMYASVSVLHRRCTQTYRVPDSDLVLEKGQKVVIPIHAIHHDSQYYPDPYRFDPERFTLENIKTRHPFVHLPFGAGPRHCIGMRFGLMQTKIGLATFMS